jgi:hypothetical protein
VKGITFLKPIWDIDTRWNSTYEMLHRALTLREALDVICMMEPQLACLTICDTDWGILLSLKSFLKKFKSVSDRVESSQ